ncbi:MaoC family dehydratase [Novosphingobium sp.]|uniref:MaoC family dehydratase n=1 Tax=Novosphingobium sp. TaxID=1874826 RepID=UPI0038BBBE8E
MKLVSPTEAQSLIGQSLGSSPWKSVDQAMIDQFADVTGDHQFIHIDPAQAALTPFGGTIAHGFLTLSLLASLMPDDALVLEGIKIGVNYGFDKVRFLQPVRSGKRVRASHKLIAVEDKGGGRFLTRTEVTVEIEGEAKPALIAEWLGMQYC